MRKICTILLFGLLLYFPCLSKAQDTYEPGFIILNDGTRLSGQIKIIKEEPWWNQRFIFFKDSAAVATDPKAKSKKYKVGDMKSYQVGQTRFEKVHYVDIDNLQFKTLGANDHMLEVLSSGRINSYRYYQYPAEVEVGFGTEEEFQAKMEKEKNDLIRGFQILTKKDNDSKFNDALDYDMQKYIGDAPDLWEKYKAGGYGNQPITQKKGLAAKMIAMAKKKAFKLDEANAIVQVFNDYDAKNAAGK